MGWRNWRRPKESLTEIPEIPRGVMWSGKIYIPSVLYSTEGRGEKAPETPKWALHGFTDGPWEGRKWQFPASPKPKEKGEHILQAHHGTEGCWGLRAREVGGLETVEGWCLCSFWKDPSVLNWYWVYLNESLVHTDPRLLRLGEAELGICRNRSRNTGKLRRYLQYPGKHYCGLLTRACISRMVSSCFLHRSRSMGWKSGKFFFHSDTHWF